jgi:hypothetical protein
MTDFEREAFTLLLEYLESWTTFNDPENRDYRDNFRKRVEAALRDKFSRFVPRDPA